MTAENGNEMWNYRPILDWTADDCFEMHRKHGIKHNPLYEQMAWGAWDVCRA